MRLSGSFVGTPARGTPVTHFTDEEPTARVNSACDWRRHAWIADSRADFEASTIPLGVIKGRRHGICLDCGAELSISARRR